MWKRLNAHFSHRRGFRLCTFREVWPCGQIVLQTFCSCELWAVDPRGKGDIAGNILWKHTSPLLQLSTQVIVDGLLYTVDSRSNLQCIDPETGEVIWSEKLKGKFNSSPIAANGNVYVSTTRGETTVFKQGRKFKKLAENNLEGEIWATPAFVDGSILMRTSKGLYRIGTP